MKVWFVPRYLPEGVQVLAAAGFVAAGALAVWRAESIRRRTA